MEPAFESLLSVPGNKPIVEIVSAMPEALVMLSAGATEVVFRGPRLSVTELDVGVSESLPDCEAA